MAKGLLFVVVAGLGVYFLSVMTGEIRYEPPLDEVIEASNGLGGQSPRPPPDPRAVAAKEWIIAHGRGNFVRTKYAPNWANGSRMHVRSNGVSYLFYFEGFELEGKVCGVWTQDPREQIFHDESCQ